MEEQEFDQFADEYYQQHKDTIRITGEEPEYFARYKIVDIRDEAAKSGIPANCRIIDFGCGIGNSIPYFREFFPQADLNCADVSVKSMDLAAKRYPGAETFLQISKTAIPAEAGSFDIAFSACVFHHIDHDDHVHWLGEMRRVTRPGGLLIIYEHNPYNPLTRRAVDTCPFDINARLLTARQLIDRVTQAGWGSARAEYRVFLPRPLAALRGLERFLKPVPLGAQYYVAARK